MKHRINRKIYELYAFDIESHNDEESIEKGETSMWLGCFINENNKMDDEESYLYDMDSFLDKLEYLSSRRRKKVKGKLEKRPYNNICIYIYNLSFEWSFILPVALKRGFKFKSKFEKEDEFVFNSVSTRSVSSVWQVSMKFHKDSGNIIFRDLSKIYGGGLGKVAKAFNLPTQKGEIDYRKNRLHNYTITQEEKEYCFKDTRIIIDILLKMMEMDDKDFFNSCSMASYTMRRLLKSSYPRNTKPYIKYRESYPELGKEESDFLRNGVSGGICYVTPEYQFKDNSFKVAHIDARQMHPTQMVTKLFPYGEGEYFKGAPTNLFNHINCCHIKISYDKALLHSIIKLIGNNYMVDNAELWVWDFELATMRKIYTNLDIEFIDGYCYKCKPLPCRKYIKQNYLDRLEAKKRKDDFYILFYKLLNNSAYGKFIEKPHNEVYENIINEDGIITSNVYNKEGEDIKVNAKYTYIPVGSCIPAYSRVCLIETALKFCPMGKNGYHDVSNICYFDTDSIFFKWNDFTKAIWETFNKEDALGNWGWEEMIDRSMFSAPKRYKTETDGVATIKAGGINFKQYKAEKVDEEINSKGLEIDDDTRREMIEKYQIPYDEINIISSTWKVQRAYRVKGGTIIEFQTKEMKIPNKYIEIYNRNT